MASKSTNCEQLGHIGAEELRAGGFVFDKANSDTCIWSLELLSIAS